MMCGMKRMESGRLQNTAPMRATTLDSCRRRCSASCERRERHRRLRDRVTCTTLRTLRWGRSRRVAQRKAERQRLAEAHKGACGERAMRTQDELAFFGFFDEGKGKASPPQGKASPGEGFPCPTLLDSAIFFGRGTYFMFLRGGWRTKADQGGPVGPTYEHHHRYWLLIIKRRREF
jgi:hypothetical protein